MDSSMEHLKFDYFYCQQTKLREGNVFTGVCDSVHRDGLIPEGCLVRGCLVSGGAWFRGRALVLGGVWSGGVLGPGGVSGPREDAWWRPPDGYCCGQYTSYWNAFFLHITFAYEAEIFHKRN